MIQNESRDPFGGNVYYLTMQITFPTRKFRNGERDLHCDVVHITTKWVPSLTLDCNGVFTIKAYSRYAVTVSAAVATRPGAGCSCMEDRRGNKRHYQPKYRGFSRDVTGSRVCLVTLLIRHFGGQASAR